MKLFTSGLTARVVDKDGKKVCSVRLLCGDETENGEFKITIKGVNGYEGAMRALEETRLLIEQEKIEQ